MTTRPASSRSCCSWPRRKPTCSIEGGNMTRNPGRVAGFLYLLLVVAAPFRLIYIPGALFVSGNATATARSEEHTSELQSRVDLVCRLLLEKKKKKRNYVI